MKTIIAGSRSFDDYTLLESVCSEHTISEVVSGGARGTDRLGERFAKEHGIPVRRFPADWNRFGHAAGPIRNRKMAEYAEACLCFWDGQSNGTRSMIDLATKYKLHLMVFNYEAGIYLPISHAR